MGIGGTLNLVRITYKDIYANDTVQVPPIVILRLSDRKGETTFEYEVPINYKFESDTTQNFVSIKILMGNWIGLHFKKKADFNELCSNFTELRS